MKIITILLFNILFTNVLYSQIHTWEKLELPDNMEYAMIHHMFTDNSGRLFIVYNTYSLMYTEDEADTWINVTLPILTEYPSYHVVGDKIIASANRTYYTTDLGKTWTDMKLPKHCKFLYWTDENELYIMENYRNILKSKDNGANWEHVYTDTTHIRAFIRAKNGEFYIGSGKMVVGQNEDIGGITKSDNKGENWQATVLYGNKSVENRQLKVAANGTILVAMREMGSNGKIYRSVDGNTWNTTNFTDAPSSILCLDNGDIYATGANSSVFMSTDNGMSWKADSYGIGDKRTVIPIVMSTIDGKLYTVNIFSEVYRTTEPVIDPSDINDQNRAEGINLTVSPNPIKDNCNVGFMLDKPTTLSLKIINILGETVYKKNDLNFDAGKHNINIDSHKLIPGVYYINISDSYSYIEYKKIIVE